jgi:hypothetical protein
VAVGRRDVAGSRRLGDRHRDVHDRRDRAQHGEDREHPQRERMIGRLRSEPLLLLHGAPGQQPGVIRRLEGSTHAARCAPAQAASNGAFAASGGVRRSRKDTNNATASMRAAIARTPFQWSMVQAVPASGPAMEEPA